jgi:hypothetical protein
MACWTDRAAAPVTPVAHAEIVNQAKSATAALAGDADGRYLQFVSVAYSIAAIVSRAIRASA